MNFNIEYNTLKSIAGPLIVVDKIGNAAYNEIVRIRLQNNETILGQVIETTSKFAIVQVFGQTTGIDISNTSVTFTGETFNMPVSEDMLGRVFNGQAQPIDYKAGIVYETRQDINGLALNPVSRSMPNDFIQTGISTIDGLMTLVRGQKLPIFSSSGLQHNQLTAQIIRQAKTRKSNENFAIVFAGIGITHDDAIYFINEFKETGAINRTVSFINFADDPSIERILTPRIALTTAEFLAFEKNMHVLVILNDMTNYAESLRELSSAKNEVPGRRGYPGYTYTDLASLFERAGIIKGKNASITQLDVVTMPGDDITHPIPDLTGYITEGQIFLSRDLANKGIYPPVNPLGSLSRLMNQGIVSGKTREDHRGIADQLYSAYAKAQEAKNLSSIVGMDALSDMDRLYLKFGESFENRFIGQRHDENRDIEQTLDIGWDLISEFPEEELSRIKSEFVQKYYRKNKQTTSAAQA